ncbi:unnamed protein product [Phaeothamnion confervicola]
MAIRAGIYVAIVTFTPQTGIVRQVLRTVLPDYAEQIPLRGEDGTWEYDGVGQTTGKQAHMASAVEELTLRQSASITRGSSLLIDDDARNIQVALLSQVKFSAFLSPLLFHFHVFETARMLIVFFWYVSRLALAKPFAVELLLNFILPVDLIGASEDPL